MLKIKFCEYENYENTLIMETISNGKYAIGQNIYLVQINNSYYYHILVDSKWDVENLYCKIEYMFAYERCEDPEIDNYFYLYCKNKEIEDVVRSNYKEYINEDNDENNSKNVG